MNYGAMLHMKRCEENWKLWNRKYGESFLLHNSDYVPESYKERFLEFREFANRISTRFLFLRKRFGLKIYNENGALVEIFLSFVRLPNSQIAKFYMVTEWTRKLTL